MTTGRISRVRRRQTLPKLSALVVAFGLLAASSPATAGPWVPEPGHGYAKVGLRWLPGLAYLPGPEAAAQGIEGPQPIGAYQEVFLGFYGEYAPCRGLAVVVHWDPLRSFLVEDVQQGKTRFHVSAGEPRLGVRAHLARTGRFNLAAEAAVTAPITSGEPVQTIYRADGDHPEVGQLRIGTGAWDIYGGIAAGLGFDRGYFAAAVGLSARSAGFDSVVSWTVEAGRPIGQKQRWQARLKLLGNHPLGDGTAPYHASPSGLGNGTHYIAFTLEADYQLRPNLFLGLSVAGGLFPVLRQMGGPVLSVSLATLF